MKKVLYIGFAVLAIGMTSCSKEEIRPNAPSNVVAPVWKANSGAVVDPSTGSGPTITDPELDGDGANITDPELAN